MEDQGAVERRGLSKQGKIIAVIVVCALVGSGFAFVWSEYFRHWTMEDIADQVTGTETYPSFKPSLANRTVTVEGTVTDIQSCGTSLGAVHLVELDDCIAPRLVYWGEIDFQVGDEVESEVSFEWSAFNNNTMLLSPQLDFPVLFHILGATQVTLSLRDALDICWTYSMESDVVTVEFEWVRDELPLSELNCSLRVGRAFWAAELVETFKPDSYGEEILTLGDLSSAVGSTGTVRYIDADVDGNLSKGDSVILSGLDVPETNCSIQCYMFLIGVGPTLNVMDGYLSMYIPLMKAGVLYVNSSPSLTPYADFEVQDEGDGFTLTACFSSGDVEWSEVSYLLSSDSDLSDWESQLFVGIDTFVDGPANGSETTWNSGPVTLGDLVWEMSVTDVDGDGVISLGDRISLVSDSDDVESVLEFLNLVLIYEPTAGTVQQFALIGGE